MATLGYKEYAYLREPLDIGQQLKLIQVIKYHEDKTKSPFATAYTLSCDLNGYQMELGIPVAEENSELPMLATPYMSKLIEVYGLVNKLNAVVPVLRNYASTIPLDYRTTITEYVHVLGIYSRALLNYNHLSVATQITPGTNVIFQETWKSWTA